jgi:hypothetical protein
MRFSVAKAGLLVAALAVVAPASPAKAAPLCWAFNDIETFYSDATYTTVVGSCTYDDCYFTYTCTGSSSAYVKYSIKRRPCNNCQACGCFASSGMDDAAPEQPEGSLQRLFSSPIDSLARPRTDCGGNTDSVLAG